jgi:hypothetical protein
MAIITQARLSRAVAVSDIQHRRLSILSYSKDPGIAITDTSTPNPNGLQSSTTNTGSQPRSSTSFTPTEFETINETVPSVPPPVYSASSTSTAPAVPTAPTVPLAPTVPAASNTTTLESVLTNLLLGSPLSTTATSTAMTARNKGKLSLRAYTSTQSVDAIQLLYVGLTQDQLTTRELDTSPKGRHASHSKLQSCHLRKRC